MKKLILILVICPILSYGQVILQSDNYSGSNQAYLNPSALAGNKLSTHFNIGTGFLNTSTNSLRNETIPFSKKNFKLGGNSHKINQIELFGPALMLQFKNNHALSVNTRYRSFQNFKGNSEFTHWFNSTKEDLNGNLPDFSLNQNAYLEYGLYYAVPVFDQERHFLKVGAGYSFLKGVSYNQLNAEGNFEFDASRFIFNNSSFNYLTTAGLHSTDLKIKDYLLGKVSAGKGSAFSAGITYEFRKKEERYHYFMNGKYRTDATENTYIVKVGLAANHIGNLTYNAENMNSNRTLEGSFSKTDIQNLDSQSDFVKFLDQNTSIGKELKENKYNLPREIVVQLDYHALKNLFLGVTHLQIKNNGKTYFGPRFEGYGANLSLYGIHESQNKGMSWGVNIRAGILNFGTENIEGFFNKNKTNAQIYAGVSLPLGKAKKLPDRDGDSVSDNKDECPDLPGLWAFNGCPDTDGDGIEDRLDECPNEAGPAETNGCPDSDGDGVFDKNDACPNEPGPKELEGCPDTDGDGIPDKDDKCPNEPGEKELDGCPDTDGDGILDKDDSCPDKRGIRELDGCPLKVIIDGDLENTFPEELKNLIYEEMGKRTRFPDSLSTLLNNYFDESDIVINLIFIGDSQEKLLEVASAYKDLLPNSLENNIDFTIRLGGDKNYMLYLIEK